MKQIIEKVLEKNVRTTFQYKNKDLPHELFPFGTPHESEHVELSPLGTPHASAHVELSPLGMPHSSAHVDPSPLGTPHASTQD